MWRLKYDEGLILLNSIEYRNLFLSHMTNENRSSFNPFHLDEFEEFIPSAAHGKWYLKGPTTMVEWGHYYEDDTQMDFHCYNEVLNPNAISFHSSFLNNKFQISGS
jgi:hypothetical protein